MEVTDNWPIVTALANELIQVVNARSALLSNFEVLTLLKELESDQLARTKTALRIKKEEEQSGPNDVKVSHQTMEEVSENLRTVEFEVCKTRSFPRARARCFVTGFSLTNVCP